MARNSLAQSDDPSASVRRFDSFTVATGATGATGPARARRLTGPTWVLVALVALIALTLPAASRSSGRLPLVAFALLTVVLMHAKGLYRPRLRLSVLDELPKMLAAEFAAALGVGIGVDRWALSPTTGTFAAMAAAAIVCQFAGRALVYALLRMARGKGRLAENCLVVGGGAVASQIMDTLRDSRRYGLRPVGFIDDDPLVECVGSAHWLGKSDRLRQVVDDEQVAVVIVAFGAGSDAMLVDRMRLDLEPRLTVLVVPRLYEVYVGRGHNDHIGAIPVVRLSRRSPKSLALFAKRLLDIAVSGTALVLCSPILAVAALAVRLESGPGVLFRQTRIGRDGTPFSLIKLRSMRPASTDESQTLWNIADDDRVGPAGRLLRKTSLDELPQLWNILRGQMSLVGPRPERPHFVDKFSSTYPSYAHRHRVRSGLTGLAQVNGLRGDTSIADRARYDNYYIDNWSFWLDLKIVAATVREVLAAGGR
jgi:exopolysaccharide biosynthesis polyprenyl glycosylphosphotransferase